MTIIPHFFVKVDDVFGEKPKHISTFLLSRCEGDVEKCTTDNTVIGFESFSTSQRFNKNKEIVILADDKKNSH